MAEDVQAIRAGRSGGSPRSSGDVVSRRVVTRKVPRRPLSDRPVSLGEFAALMVVVLALMLLLGHIVPGGS